MGWKVENNFFLFPLFVLLLLQGTAHADVITGFAELIEQIGRSRNVSSEGLTSVSNSTYFLQRYNLDYNSAIFPQVYLRAGMRVEKQALNSETDGITNKLTSTVLMPSAGLTLSNRFIVAGIGYDERDEKTESAGTTLRTFRETQNAFLGFRPEGLPTLDLRYTEQKRYDADRTSIDQEDRMLSLNSFYRPVRSVQLYYNASYEDNENHISQIETKALSQSARVSYGDRFFDDRVALSTNYNITSQDVQIFSAGAEGTMQTQLFPLAGLSALNDTPTIGALVANPALIDGNLTASSGMNIGQLPSLGGDTKKRNAGLDFGLPVDVSTLFVWMDRSLPADIANSFVWDIYISSDNQNWSLYQTVFPATFGQFDNRFEIAISPVQTRYIMAVTRPLSVAIIPSPGVDVGNIFITELQAFFDQAVSLAPGTSKNTVLNSESVDVNARVHIIRSDRHTLLYDLYYLTRTTDQADETGQSVTRASTLTNALTANERFNKVLTGNAKVMRQYDEFTSGGKLTTYDYEASLMAAMTSLPKLSHLAVVAGKREVFVETDTTKDTGSLSLTNTAEVYPGINVHLGGIENLVSTTTDTTVSHTESTTVSFGTDIVPHRALTIAMSYDWSETEQRGNDVSIIAATTRRQSTYASVAYNPFSSLYLFGSIQRIEETGKPGITAGIFSGSWSTQRTGGALELRFSYSDNIETETRTRTRNYGPSARWKINASTILDVSYVIATIDTPLDETESSAVNASLKMTF